MNCRFEPDTVVETTLRMKKAVENAGLKCHYMCQPLAYRTADAGRLGFVTLPECPLGNRFCCLSFVTLPENLISKLVEYIFFEYVLFQLLRVD